jgi:hypothetical protein
MVGQHESRFLSFGIISVFGACRSPTNNVAPSAPVCLRAWVAARSAEDSPVRVIDMFGWELDLGELGFNGVDPEITAWLMPIPGIRLRRNDTVRHEIATKR